MLKCVLKILDQVNVKFVGLDPITRRKIVDRLKFFIPSARHTPQFKLGRWDGTVSFATIGGGTYLNLLELALPIVIDANYDIQIEDHRPTFNFNFPEITDQIMAHKVWPENHPHAGEPIVLRDYQVEALRLYTQGNQQAIVELATGSGKTIITACLSSLCEPYGRSICIVPSKSLIKQTEADYRNLGLDVGVFYGDRKEWGHTHTICTWQSLAVFAKKSKADPTVIPIAEFMKDVVCVIVDECHGTKAKHLRELLDGPFATVPIRCGMSGTIPKEEFNFYSLLGTIGPVVGKVTAVELQEKGVLANCEIEFIQTQEPILQFDNYHDEHKYLTSEQKRLNWFAKYCEDIASTGNTLVLLEHIECGKYLESICPGSKFIYGSTKTNDRTDEYSEFVTADNKLLYAGFGIASTGISITRIHNLILFEAGQSAIRVIQSIGRGLRKGFDKDNVVIKDVCSSLKYSKKHMGKRKLLYKHAEYPYTITKINY